MCVESTAVGRQVVSTPQAERMGRATVKELSLIHIFAIGSSASYAYGIYTIYRMIYAFATGNTEHLHAFSMDLYFESAAMILTLITLGKYLETRSKGKTCLLYTSPPSKS